MKLKKWVLDLFFPPRCPFCSKIKETDGICSDCQQTLPWIGETVAPAKGEFISGCYAPLWYSDLVRESFHRYKFSGRIRYRKIYGQLMAQSIEDRLEKVPDCISWAPISRSRLRRRGYDQSKLLAEELSKCLNIPLVSTLEKWRNIPAQSSLDDEHQRRANVLGAYRMVETADVVGKRVLLVDDIFTSGSTMSECARILCTAGAGEVLCVTLARGDKKK